MLQNQISKLLHVCPPPVVFVVVVVASAATAAVAVAADACKCHSDDGADDAGHGDEHYWQS